jgi:predicted RNA-binding protein with PUA-like domain
MYIYMLIKRGIFKQVKGILNYSVRNFVNFRIISCLPRWLFYTDNIKHPHVDIDLVESVINGELVSKVCH